MPSELNFPTIDSHKYICTVYRIMLSTLIFMNRKLECMGISILLYWYVNND